jgi:hypothetical protein
MAPTASLPSTRTAGTNPAATWPTAGRVAASATLVLAAGVPLVSHVTQPTLPGTEDAVAWAAADAGTAELTKLLDVLALPFLFGAALVYVLLSRQGSPRLAYAGGALLGCGLVGLSAVEGYEALAVSLAGDPRTDRDGLVTALDQTEGAAAMLMLVLLLGGALVGTLLLAGAFWRSGAVPREIAVLLPLPILVDVVVTEGLGIGPHWVSHALSLVVGCLIAGVVLSARPAGAER